MQPLFRKAVMKLFEQDSTPQKGIRTLFKTPTSNVSDTLSLNLDIVRRKRKIAIDIARDAGGRYNKFNVFTNKEYFPPSYNEYTDFKSTEGYQRQPGQTEYAPKNDAVIAQNVAKNLIELGEIVDRGEIKQAHDALFVGKVTLINGDIISFDKKTLHDKVPSVKWDAATPTILADIEAQIRIIVKDAKRSVDNINMVCDPALITPVLKAVKAANVDYADPNAFMRAMIQMPTDINMDGMSYHGKFSINGYTVLLWSYDDRYEIPTGLGLANEGTETTYIPSGSALLYPNNARMDMLYAGVDVNDFSTNAVYSRLFGLRNFNPKIVKGARIPYAMPDMVSFGALNYGIKAAPLAVPTDIDSTATLSSCLT